MKPGMRLTKLSLYGVAGVIGLLLGSLPWGLIVGLLLVIGFDWLSYFVPRCHARVWHDWVTRDEVRRDILLTTGATAIVTALALILLITWILDG